MNGESVRLARHALSPSAMLLPAAVSALLAIAFLPLVKLEFSDRAWMRRPANVANYVPVSVQLMVAPPLSFSNDVQFVRVIHDGAGWDDGMEANGADANFLKVLGEVSGFKHAKTGQAIRISWLRYFPKRNGPPLLYLTGDGSIEGISAYDLSILRRYIKEGGMLFVDSGSAKFDESFKVIAGHLFPDRGLIDVPITDDLFEVPFKFSKFPSAWEGNDNRTMGIRMDDGRLGVVYFAGNLNEGWKPVAMKAGEQRQSQSIKLGLNIVYYAMVRHSELAR